jgi:hypothetical protein
MGRLGLELVFVLRLVLVAITGAEQQWVTEDRARPVELPDYDCARVVGSNLRAIKMCHVLEERDGLAEPGKLMVTLDIAPTGEVADVRLDGAVGSVRFADCVRARARNWTFPRFRWGPVKKFTFPVVFLADERRGAF